jgi:hypothetical protein
LNEQAVFQVPRLWTASQHGVLEGPERQPIQARVHSLRVRYQQRPVFLGKVLRSLCRDLRKLVEPGRFVAVYCAWTNELAQPSGRDPAQHIHLKKAFLCMNKAQGKELVRLALRLYRDKPPSITLDC